MPKTEVKVGQVWQDMDYRMRGARLIVIDIQGDYAICRRNERTIKILLRRFRQSSTGYRLVGPQ